MRTWIAVLLFVVVGPLIATAQAPPSTVVYTKPSPSDAYVAANAGTTLVSADKGGLTFKKSNGRYARLYGGGLAYQQGAQWFASKLQVSSYSDASGWSISGTAAGATLTGNKGQDKDLTFNSGSVSLSLHAPQLAYGGADTFTFQESGTTWQLRASEADVSIQTTVTKRRGKGTGTHTFGYSVSGSALQVDSIGHLHAGGQIHLTRPLIVGADQRTYFVCSAWSFGPANLSFTCDDSGLPDSAFPYVIDPSFTVGSDWAPTYFEQTASSGSSSYFSWMDTFEIAQGLPDDVLITNESVNTGSLSWSEESDPGLGQTAPITAGISAGGASQPTTPSTSK